MFLFPSGRAAFPEVKAQFGREGHTSTCCLSQIWRQHSRRRCWSGGATLTAACSSSKRPRCLCAPPGSVKLEAAEADVHSSRSPLPVTTVLWLRRCREAGGRAGTPDVPAPARPEHGHLAALALQMLQRTKRGGGSRGHSGQSNQLIAGGSAGGGPRASPGTSPQRGLPCFKSGRSLLLFSFHFLTA